MKVYVEILNGCVENIYVDHNDFVGDDLAEVVDHDVDKEDGTEIAKLTMEIIERKVADGEIQTLPVHFTNTGD